MGKDPTSLPEDRSEWPTFLSGGKLPKAGEPEPEEGADENGDGHLAPPPHVLGYGSVGRGRYSAQQQQQGAGARTYALQPISSSVPNPSASGPRMHDYAIRAGDAGAQAVQVAPGLLGVRTPVMAPSHAVIGGSPVAASASVSASVPLSVSRSVSGASSSRRSDSKSTTSTTSSSEDVDIDIDIDVDGDEDTHSHRGGLHRLRRRQEHDIEVDVEGMEEGDVDEEEGRGVVSVRPMSRVRWEEQQQQEHPVQGGVGKGVQYNHLGDNRDGFQANNGVYGASAVGHAYGHALSSSYSSTGSVGYSPGYGAGSYGARRGGVAMKREEDEMSVSFSVREEDEEEEEAEAEAEEGKGGAKRGWSSERRWDGMEMEVDMDMD